jgi:cation diffusion facilitator family transporter
MYSKAKSRAAAVSVVSNTALTLLKLVVGLLSGSVSILSEAIHSANDLLAAVIAFVSVRRSDREADAEHPYGHGKIEGISGAIESALIVGAALWIIVEAVQRIRTGGEVAHLGAGTAVMVTSVVVNVLVSRYLFRVGRAEDSLALQADAHHLATDVYTSLGVAVGLVAVWVTGYSIIDPLVAIVVALFILRIGFGLTNEAAQHLLDRAWPDDELARARQILTSHPAVLEAHKVRTRKSGSQRLLDAHVVMSGQLSLEAAHDVADGIEDALAAEWPSIHSTIHVEPIESLPPERRAEILGARNSAPS